MLLRLFLLSFPLLLQPCYSLGQQTIFQIPDSIEAITNDTARLKKLVSTSRKHWYNSPNYSLFYLRHAQAISNKIKDPFYQVLIYSDRGIVLSFLGKNDSSVYYMEKAITYNKEQHGGMPEISIASFYNNLGQSYYKLKNYPKALASHYKALDIRKAHKSKKLGSTYNNLGLVYMDLNEHDKAIEFFEKALAVKEKNEDRRGVANTLNNLGIVYKDMRHGEKAMEYYQRSLALSQEINDLDKTANVLGNIGQLEYWKDNYRAAISYYKQAWEIHHQIGDKQNACEMIGNISMMHLKLKDYSKALPYMKECIQMASENNFTSILGESYLSLSEYFSVLDQSDSSSYYYLKYKAISDSLEKLSDKEKILAVEEKYKAAQKQQQIELLEQQDRIKSLEVQRLAAQRLWIGLLAALLLLLSLGLFWLYRYRTQTNKALKMSNATKDRMFSVIAHDIKNPLLGFRSITQSLSLNWAQLEKGQIHYFIQKLEKSSAQLYLLIQNLLQWAIHQGMELSPSKSPLEIQKLVAEVIELFRINAEQKNIRLLNKVDPDLILHADPKMMQTIFRNLIDNAIKFTPEGGTIEVGATPKEQKLQFYVQDNGAGIPSEKIPQLFDLSTSDNKYSNTGAGLGLVLCKELVEKQGGSIEVETELGKGSIFKFDIQNYAAIH